MAITEELEQRVLRLETLFEDVLKEKRDFIALRLDQIYEKTERDKFEILTKTERDKTEILAQLYEKIEQNKTEILVKTEKDKTEIIKWTVGSFIGFSVLIISALALILPIVIK
ncbi:hypothetical protein M1N54_04350 [Thermodesulfovibrionales bacterium]|nr:hypothetical protein [Thermodesulfovibrionales bacterium]